jgi:hypothetical protein
MINDNAHAERVHAPEEFWWKFNDPLGSLPQLALKQ